MCPLDPFAHPPAVLQVVTCQLVTDDCGLQLCVNKVCVIVVSICVLPYPLSFSKYCASALSAVFTCRTGDVCVSPFSVNWDCRKASWSMSAEGYPNQCTFPQQSFLSADASLFGQCQFTDVSARELALSDEVLGAAAAKADKLPVRNNIIQVRCSACHLPLVLLLG